MATLTETSTKQVLRDFYVAYGAWLDGGAKSGEFLRGEGLCANLFDYCTRLGIETAPAQTELHKSFKLAGLSTSLPFNANKTNHEYQRNNDLCYLNPLRVAWVRARIDEGEPQ